MKIKSVSKTLEQAFLPEYYDRKEYFSRRLQRALDASRDLIQEDFDIYEL